MVAADSHDLQPPSDAIACLAEVARVVLVKHDPVVVLATSIAAASWMLPVLADTAMPG